MATPLPQMRLVSSSKTLLKTLVSILHTRLQILAFDMEEDRLYLMRVFNMLCLTLCAFGMALLLLNTLLVVLFWEHHRVLTLSLLASGYLCIGLVSWRCTVVRARKKPPLFDTSLSEFAKDWQSIDRPDQAH